MKYRLLFVLLLLTAACKRYKDPAPFTDPRIQDKYCNIPSAINYNWNFPGIPNDSVCIFPAQIYKGTYFFRDSITDSSGNLLTRDSFYLTFTQIDTTRLFITGFCPNDTIRATANRFFRFTLDTLIGYGQALCNPADTIFGHGSKVDLNDTTTIRLSYQIASDTGLVYHIGTAIKQ